MKLREGHTQAEAVLEHGLDVFQADAVDNVLVHGPTLQAVEVLVPPFVSLGLEPLLAVLAPMPEASAAEHLAADASAAELKVEGELAARFL